MTESDKDAIICELAKALARLLKSSEREVVTSMAMNAASKKFSDYEPEIKAYEKAMIESSASEKQARAALSRVPAELRGEG